MSILAEPRRKKRLSVDPQNLQWKNDKQKQSWRLMKRMGWSEGDGLGRNRQGRAEYLKLKANNSGRGLGADKLASYDSTWIRHHEDFADLLNSLNKLKEQDSIKDENKEKHVKKVSLWLNIKSLRRRIHYQKFIRSKHVSNYSPNDRSAVMGIGLNRTKPEDSEQTKLLNKSEQQNDGIFPPSSNTTVSTLSVQEYFATKMATLKAKTEQSGNETKVNVEIRTPEMSSSEEWEQHIDKDEMKEQKKRELERKNSLQYRLSNKACGVKAKFFEGEDELCVNTERCESKKRKKEKKLIRQRQQRKVRNGQDAGVDLERNAYETAEFLTTQRDRIEENEGDNVVSEEIVYKPNKKKRKSAKWFDQ